MSLLTGGVEENRGVAIFLYTFLGKMAESVEENEGVPVFLYIFLVKMAESVEENEGVPVFLYIFLVKMAESVEENEGMPVFLYTFHENPDFGVEENGWVAIFLPFFDRNVIFAVEENEGVAIFLYSYDKATTKSPMNDQNAVSACGRRLEKSRGAPSGALPYRMISGRKSGPARLPLFLFLKGRAAGGCPTAASRERWGKKRPVGAMERLYFAIIE